MDHLAHLCQPWARNIKTELKKNIGMGAIGPSNMAVEAMIVLVMAYRKAQHLRYEALRACLIREKREQGQSIFQARRYWSNTSWSLFKADLVEDVIDGEITLDEALARVEQARLPRL